MFLDSEDLVDSVKTVSALYGRGAGAEGESALAETIRFALPAVRFRCAAGGLSNTKKWFQQVDGQGENRRRTIFCRDLHQGLQVTELQGNWTDAHDLGGVSEALCGLEFTLGGDHLGPAIPLCFGL